MVPIGEEVVNSLVWFFFAVRRRGKHFVQRGDVLAYAFMQWYMIFLKTFFSVVGRLLYSWSHFFLKTVSILEQRLTMTENKLWECSDYQLTLLEQFPTEYRSDSGLLWFSFTSLCDWSRKLVSQLAIKCKIKTNHYLVTRVSSALRRLPVSILSSHWLRIMVSFFFWLVVVITLVLVFDTQLKSARWSAVVITLDFFCRKYGCNTLFENTVFSIPVYISELQVE